MKPFDDKDLIAYHLHELSPRRARALERALQTDPSLAAESEAYAATLRAFKGAHLTVDEEVLARNWRALRPSLVAHHTRRIAPSRWHLPALAGGALAFAGTLVFITTHHRENVTPVHHAATPPRRSSMRQARDTAHSLPASESSLTSTVPIIEKRDSIQEHGRIARSFPLPITSGPQGSAPRKIADLPLATEAVTDPHFIPLASVPLPALPAMPLPLTTVELAATGQAADPKSLSKSQRRISAHHEHPTDLTLSMGGTLIGTREVSSSGTESHSQGATHAVSAMAAFHQQLRPAVGYRIAVSYTRPDFHYGYRGTTTTGSAQNIDSSVYELAATYVVQGPHRGALSTSAEAGAGLMGFLPTPQRTDTSYNLRGAAVIGIAADVALTKHLAVHAAYRAQVFRGPDFNYNGVATPVVTTTLFSNEPTIGITYRFSHK